MTGDLKFIIEGRQLELVGDANTSSRPCPLQGPFSVSAPVILGISPCKTLDKRLTELPEATPSGAIVKFPQAPCLPAELLSLPSKGRAIRQKPYADDSGTIINVNLSTRNQGEVIARTLGATQRQLRGNSFILSPAYDTLLLCRVWRQSQRNGECPVASY